jgi:high-affinity iron transporter
VSVRAIRIAITVPSIGLALAAVLSGCGRAAAPTADEGRALYAENGCASCHGVRGQGNGPVAANLTSPPTDFRDVTAFKNGYGVEAIATSIEKGVDAARADEGDVPGHHRRGMPPFRHLSDAERQSLALYVMSFREPDR